MKSHFTFALPGRCGLALLLGLAGGAHAQVDRNVASVEVARHSPVVQAGSSTQPSSPTHIAAASAENAAPAQPLRVRHIEIGSATQTLWDMQRASPGVRPRPIDGDQASRSYQRYLKSFETAIPEHYTSGLGGARK